jgi:hypothetical protein
VVRFARCEPGEVAPPLVDEEVVARHIRLEDTDREAEPEVADAV